MPHLMNCLHSDDGWCLDCVKSLHNELEAIRDALTKARSYAVNKQKRHPVGLVEFSRECGVSPTRMSQWTTHSTKSHPDVF